MAKFVIFATYYQQEKSAYTLINSLIQQTYEDWELVICSNGDESVHNLDILDSRIKVKVSKPTGNWGCYNREEFRKTLPPNSYLINTSVEDYYAPITLKEISKHKDDLIYWDFSHHHFGYDSTSTTSNLSISNIDWGNFAVKSEVASRVPISNCKSYEADGEWVLDLKKYIISQRGNTKKIDKVLFVKN